MPVRPRTDAIPDVSEMLADRAQFPQNHDEPWSWSRTRGHPDDETFHGPDPPGGIGINCRRKSHNDRPGRFERQAGHQSLDEGR
jgi:hypothetical protein